MADDKPPTTDSQQPEFVSRAPKKIDLYQDLNKVVLVPGSAATGKRGKGVGFYCEACNLTFKDSIEYLDHLGSKQHLYNTTGSADGISQKNSAITVEQIRERLKKLYERKQKQLGENAQEFDLQKRIREQREKEERERLKKKEAQIARRKKRKEGKLKRKREEMSGGGDQRDQNNEEGNDDNENINSTNSNNQADDMASMMGFAGFGTTKK